VAPHPKDVPRRGSDGRKLARRARETTNTKSTERKNPANSADFSRISPAISAICLCHMSEFQDWTLSICKIRIISGLSIDGLMTWSHTNSFRAEPEIVLPENAISTACGNVGKQQTRSRKGFP
jgi:hypothetical protein